ncbi:MAG: ATP-binding protein, partial [Gammaproteobacteria bacterium]|nr:ATP-binding protein [Gammaproteobacteria bacterium]
MDVGIRRVIEGTPVLKLKLYDQKGVMKYSSNMKDIKFGDGDDLQVINKVNLITLDVIKNRKPFASYNFRTVFDDGEREYYDRYIMSVYLPAKSRNSEKIGGVVEIYYDVTDIINSFMSNRNVSNAILACTGLVLVILIGYLIKRAEKESQYKYLQREKYLNLIKHKNQDLIRKTKELRKIKERAERLVDEKSAFLSRMSHELRTPMNAVIGLTDLVMRTSLTDKQKGYVNAIQSSGSMLLDITDEILTIGRLETGCLELKSQKFVIREVIENVIEVLGNRAASHKIELLCDCDFFTQTTVIGDPVRLRQILLNLVSNAIRHTDAKGNVLIKVIHNKGNFGSEHYHFEVSDTGVGISEDDQRRIFAAYCHLNITTKSREKNTGLGLAICKRLVEVMNGAIGVDSSPGNGATFWFKLPLHTGHSSQSIDKNIESKLPKNSRILVVMENLEAANNIQVMLGSFGGSLDIVNTYNEAVEFIEKSFVELKPYSLFIVDARINEECGIRLSKHIRTYSALDKVSIVIMVPISESLGKGVISNISKTVCINKPVLPSRLIKLVFDLHANNTVKEP